jgi:hypothetical protein
MQRPVIISPKCAVCKAPSKLDYGRHNAKTLEFLMLKYLPNCQHIMHVKCCEKAFKIISYEKRNKFLIVSQYFNKCRHDNKAIFPGLMSINIIFEKDKKPSTGNNNNRVSNKSLNKIRTNTPLDDIALPGLFNIKSSHNNNMINKKIQGYSSNTNFNVFYTINKINAIIYNSSIKESKSLFVITLFLSFICRKPNLSKLEKDISKKSNWTNFEAIN